MEDCGQPLVKMKKASWKLVDEDRRPKTFQNNSEERVKFKFEEKCAQYEVLLSCSSIAVGRVQVHEGCRNWSELWMNCCVIVGNHPLLLKHF